MSRILISGDIQCREDVLPAKLSTTKADPHELLSNVSLIFPSYPDTPSPSISLTLDKPDNNPDPIVKPATKPPSDLCEPVTKVSPCPREPALATDLRRSEWTRAPVVRYGFSATDHTSAEHDHLMYSQAMKEPKCEAWKEAFREEFDSLLQHNVGILVNAPPTTNVLAEMGWLSHKWENHNRIVRYKARWVAFGNHQVKGVNYKETYASVGSVNSL